MTLRCGVFARASDRGLGMLAREVVRHLSPERVLIIRPDAESKAGLVCHREWYPADSQIARYDGRRLNESQVKAWLRGLDVVLHFETLYDYRVADFARDAGAVSVAWLMPEYHGMGRGPGAPEPDQWFAPTSWRLDHLPERTRVVPVPVPIDRWPVPARADDGPPRWLHVGGAPYPVSHDRNGTRIFLNALQFLKGEHRVTIRSQGVPLPLPVRPARDVHVEVHTTPVDDYWRMYDDADALVLPRRYGGLSLPANEAMGAGLALVMPAVSPNLDWPIVPVTASVENHIAMSGGQIPYACVDPRDLAEQMDALAASPDRLREAQREAREWAQAHSWEALGPTIVAELERAAGL